MRKQPRRRQDGMALLTVTLFIAVAALVLGALSLRVVNQNHQVNQYLVFRDCFQGLETGLAQSKVSLESGGSGMIGMGSWTLPTDESGNPVFTWPSFGDDTVSPLQIPSMPEVAYMSFVLDWGSDGLDNNGDGTIDGPDEARYYAIYPMSLDRGVERRAEVVVEGSDVNVWNNAVFAGAGHASGAVQGNCSIHGSVHILGTQVPEGGEAIVVLDLMGASLIHNNYGLGPGPGPALSDRLRDSVPVLPQTIVNGETVDTLNAVLRVKNGLVSLNSASEVGESDIYGNPQKETMDATFNDDGWCGSRVTDDGDRGDPEVVYSDNGWDYEYDLGDKVSLPLLTDDWRWPDPLREYELGYPYSPVPGGTEISPDGDNYIHQEFFSDVLSDGDPYSGDVTITSNTDFYLNLSRPDDADPAHRVTCDSTTGTAGDDYLYYDSSTQVLEINGQIEINGDLKFLVNKTGAAVPSIYYTGRAAILVHGDVTINTDLYACNNGDPTNYANCFPAANCIGIMASQNMILGQTAQMDAMGAFYAQGQVSSSKQTCIMGTFVANYFDMGNQVPDIFQVPDLVTNLPLGMVGNWPLLVFSEVSWREV
ncbi:MAG: hypothetical protein JXR94_09870 [Candidatus Hydrogenedentes bacterium]|nr:hypothetical protein [Candidatus Hydrogenedentota bacterium]